ncbi:hypothetical protein [Sandaracinus amylolyticus]|uniref:hypothetical protein n=1 Tax=Sandaracinus amylolyticus TaxID=927083 RepID=UPI001F320A26|nr:hypothetical protein [Sandaracinus amylolyticus]UJR78735.1 TPR domain protein, putative component of TonB system [Sandaracinus amylolyticus]
MDATAEELIARLRRNPDDASAYAALRAHYQRIGDYASLANLLEGWAGRSTDHGAASQAFFEAGELAWGALGDRARSMRLYERSLERNAAHADAGLRLTAIYEEAADHRRLAELLERRADALAHVGGDARDVAALQHRLGEVWEHSFKRADKAITHYRKAFELDPTLVPAIYAAREIYRQAGNLKAAATLCELESKAEPDPERKVALLRELAHVRAHDLADLEGAVVALKRALGVAPGDVEVMQDLARVYLTRAEQSGDAMIADADRRRAADVLFQLAQKLPPADAVTHLETALDGAPDHDGALALLERIAERVGHFDLLPRRWVAFLARAPEAPGAGERRRRLAKAYLDAGQVDYAITCLEWLLEEGDAEAASQLVELYRRAGRDEDALRALTVASQGLPPNERIPRLREMVGALRARGDEEGAVASARQILEIDASDAEALALVEEHLRKRGEWAPLRELLLGAARMPGLSVEARTQRLREVAALSERRLQDAEGAIGAWKGVAALDPSDREARAALVRLLEATERWDDLVQVLEREALSTLEPQQKAEVYRRLAAIHRDRRGDLEEAMSALRNLRDLVPTDAAGRDALCDVLLAAGAFTEAIPMLKTRIEQADGAHRAALCRSLARVLEERMSDEEGAFSAWARVLEDEPGDPEALARMEAIDERAGNADRLLTTLSYRADVEDGPERAATYTRMGRIAAETLRDLAQAGEFYARAHELAPRDEAILDALCDVYDRSERFKDLVVLLRERARLEEDRAMRAALYRRIARTLRERVGNEAAAAEAYREVLDAGEDVEALSFLRDRARAQDDVAALDEALERLANIAEAPSDKRDLLLERAALLAERLDRPRDAIELSNVVVRTIDPTCLPALELLATWNDRIEDRHGVADALERTLQVLEDPGLRVPVAKRLSDLYEDELRDPARAIDALYAWADADLTEAEPLRRLIALLEPAERWKDLVIALDSLADLGDDPSAVSALVRRSAEIAFRRLGDVDGAWEKLAERAREGDSDAEAQLRELARAAGLAPRLVEHFVSIAESSDDAAIKRARWLDAARVQEELGDAGAALESTLKALAIDLDAVVRGDDRAVHDEVDRLAVKAAAWPRLAQVYETLIRRAEEKERKIELLLRHASLLDQEAEDPSGALDRALRACSLAPNDDEVLAVAEDLAPRAGRGDELLVVYDRRRGGAKDDASRIEALLRAVRLCEDGLEDREKALSYLAQAVALGVRSRELAPRIEEAARELDRERGKDAASGLLRGLVDVYAAIAEDMEADPKGGAALLLRASRLLESELDEPDGAWGALLRASTFAPSEPGPLDALESLGARNGRLPMLDQHLAKLVEDALDSKTAAALLRRRASVLEHLGRHGDAAEVLGNLKAVAPNDPEARVALRHALRRAARHQDLLLALDSDLVKARGDREQEIALRKEIALTWEHGLRNRWEALEAWQKVQKLAPDDADVAAALARIEGRSRDVLDDDSVEASALDVGLAETEQRDLATARAGEHTDPGIDAPPEPGLDQSDALEVPPSSALLPTDSVEATPEQLDEPGEQRPMSFGALPPTVRSGRVEVDPAPLPRVATQVLADDERDWSAPAAIEPSDVTGAIASPPDDDADFEDAAAFAHDHLEDDDAEEIGDDLDELDDDEVMHADALAEPLDDEDPAEVEAYDDDLEELSEAPLAEVALPLAAIPPRPSVPSVPPPFPPRPTSVPPPPPHGAKTSVPPPPPPRRS